MALTMYTTPGIPNPDVVHMYLEETGRQDAIKSSILDVGKGENRSAKNPNILGEVPCLVLGDGTALANSTTIVKYLDEKLGFTSIVGVTAEERAVTDMWLSRVETKVENPMGLAFRCGPMAKFFAKRRPGYIDEAAAEPARKAAQAGLQWLNDELLNDGRSYVCGERFSLADLRLYNNVGFYVKMDPFQKIPAGLTHVHAYMARVAARASAKAIIPKKAKL